MRRQVSSNIPTRTWGPLIGMGAFVLGTVIACGSTGDSVFDDPDGGASSSSGTSGDGFDRGDGGSSGSSGTPADLVACATDKQQAKLAPLDLLVMQDISGSMYAFTSGTTTKWGAVKSALDAFMTAPASAGLGLGLSFFPVFTNAPNSCTTDAECGAAGPCLLRGCNGAQTRLCTTNNDCQGNAQCVELGRCHDSGETLCVPGVPTTCVVNGISRGACDRPLDRGVCFAPTLSCQSASYEQLVVPIAALPGAAAAANAALAARVPRGSTPTLGALQGAIAAGRAHANANPGRVVSVVLSTDGLPGTNGACDDRLSEIVAAAQAGVSGSPSIKTFVIGVFAPIEAGTAKPTLDAIAAAGGTGTATVLGTSANTTADFIAALDKVRGASLPCELALPVPASGTPDYAKVNVVFTDSTTNAQSLVGYVGEASACDPAKGGWYYDVKPDAGKPTKVVLCPATCSKVQGDAKGAIEVVQGCETKTQDPPR